MALVSSGNQIALQGTGDTNPVGQTFHLDTTITSASTSCTLVGFTRTTELGDNFYGTENTLSGTIYGFKTAQTSEYSGSARLTRGFDDTNPQVASNSLIKGSGFFDNAGWFGSGPANSLSNENWWTSAGVVGVTLGVDENSLGSISTQSYTGGGSVGTLEVHQFGWFNNASSAYPNGTTLNTESEGNWIMLVLKNTSSSPPNSNDSFYSVQINGQEFLRSDAATTTQSSNAAYDSNVSSGTHYYRTWRWDAADVTDSDLTAIGTTGSKTFKLSKSAPGALNTGIAEEFGGADSSNVALSDYYKGDLHDTTGIPTSGQIKFSEFLGKTYQAVSTITSFTGGTGGGKLQKKGFAVSGELNAAFGSNLSPATQDAFGANVDLRYCYIADNTMNLRIKYDINSGTVNTTSWSTLTVSRSGYTNITISRTSLTSNAVTSGNYYITTATNSMSNTQMNMLGGGTVTLTFT